MDVRKAVDFFRMGLREYYGTKTVQMNWYFNNTPLRIMGVSAGQLRALNKEFKAACGNDPGQDFIHQVSGELWDSDIFEEKGRAIGVLSLYPQYFNETTWQICAEYLETVDNWAFHDFLATDFFGSLILLDMSRFKRLAQWTRSPNLWKRRCSAVSTVPLNQGGNKHPELSFKMCAPLMGDAEIMVQKGVSWTIRTASKHDPKGAFELLMKYKNKTSRWILRDGGAKLPEKMRRKVLAK